MAAKRGLHGDTNGNNVKRARKTSTSQYADDYLIQWHNFEAKAEEMVPIVGKLYRKNDIVIHMHGNSLVKIGPVAIIKVHSKINKQYGKAISIEDTFAVLKALGSITTLTSCRIDLVKVTEMCITNAIMTNGGSKLESFTNYLSAESSGLADPVVVGSTQSNKPRQDVVLYGFGRIGRIVLRLLIKKIGSGQNLVPRAIVVRDKGVKDDLIKRATLLKLDSVHGPFDGTIDVKADQKAIIVNGVFIKVIYSNAPDTIDYTQYGINDAVVVDNTGKWRDRKGLSLHLKSKGTAKVMLTAPAKGSDIPCIVCGINNQDIPENVDIISAASCTTNAISPPLKLIDEAYTIKSGHVETVHAFTNDQNLTDNFHAKERRGRAAPLNMVLTETGAAKAVVKVLPQLEGKLTANAIRVPTPNVSLAVLILNLEKAPKNREEINDIILASSLDSPIHNQISLSTSHEAASSDMVGNRHPAVVDGPSTIVKGNTVTLYVWYDNEWGYSCQVVRLLQKICNVRTARFPPTLT